MERIETARTAFMIGGIGTGISAILSKPPHHLEKGHNPLGFPSWVHQSAVQPPH